MRARIGWRGLSSGLSKHYLRVPETYHTAWFYGKDTPYEVWQRKILRDALQCEAQGGEHELVDIGGGTGRFAALLRETLKIKRPTLCVDPSDIMLEKARASYGDKVKTLCMDAVSFAKTCQPKSFQRCLLKEVVHHIPRGQVDTVFKGLHRGLVSGGVCVILTRPRENIDYPFMERARQVWQEQQPDEQLYLKSLKASGFDQISNETHSFPVKMPQSLWLNMVQDRFWSTFSETNFSKKQLALGVEEIKTKFPAGKDGNLQFTERVVVIRAKK